MTEQRCELCREPTVDYYVDRIRQSNGQTVRVYYCAEPCWQQHQSRQQRSEVQQKPIKRKEQR